MALGPLHKKEDIMRGRIATLAAIAALSAAAMLPGTASADSGTFTTDSGENCSWYGYSSFYSIDCSGYSRRAGGYVNYHCDVNSYGYGSSSWRCHDLHGNTWSGSR